MWSIPSVKGIQCRIEAPRDQYEHTFQFHKSHLLLGLGIGLGLCQCEYIITLNTYCIGLVGYSLKY